PVEGEDVQLRDRLRPERLRARRPAEHPARGGQGDDRHLPRAVPEGRRVHRAHDRGGPRARPRDDALRPPPADPRAQGAQLGGALARRAPRGQHADPGDRGRRDQARDDRLRARPRRRGPAHAAHPHHPRRAALRGPTRRDRRGARAGRARDDRALGRPPAAARGRHRRRRDLAGGQVVDRGAAVVLTALVGGCIALQAPINSHLGRSVGTFQAAFLSFAIGTVLLAVIAALASGGMGQIGEARHLPWYYLTGGVLGAAYVTTVLVTVRTPGAGGVAAPTI